MSKVSQMEWMLNLPMDKDLFINYFVYLNLDTKKDMMQYFTKEERVAILYIIKDCLIIENCIENGEEHYLTDLIEIAYHCEDILYSPVTPISEAEFSLLVMYKYFLGLYESSDFKERMMSQPKQHAMCFFDMFEEVCGLYNKPMPEGYEELKKEIHDHLKLKLLK